MSINVISEKRKALTARKQRILDEIKYYDNRIEEFHSKASTRRKVLDYEDNSDTEPELSIHLDTGPSLMELKEEQLALKTCLQATQELTNLEVLQSEVNVLVESPPLSGELPVLEEGTWREVTAECCIDLVPFSITFYVHHPDRKFAPLSFRSLRVLPVKKAHEVELAKSVLPGLTRPSDAIEVLRSYAAAHRSRRSTLARLADKFASSLFMEPMPEGGYVLKCADLLEVSWVLQNKWSPIAPFHHRMKFDLEFMDESYIKIIAQLHRQLSDPQVDTQERTLLLTKIITICIEAQRPTQELYESSDSETAKKLQERRTTLDREPEIPDMRQTGLDKDEIEGVSSSKDERKRDSTKKRDLSERDAKTGEEKEVMAPPKSLPKKGKRVVEGKKIDKAVKRSMQNDNRFDGVAKRMKSVGVDKRGKDEVARQSTVDTNNDINNKNIGNNKSNTNKDGKENHTDKTKPNKSNAKSGEANVARAKNNENKIASSKDKIQEGDVPNVDSNEKSVAKTKDDLEKVNANNIAKMKSKSSDKTSVSVACNKTKSAKVASNKNNLVNNTEIDRTSKDSEIYPNRSDKNVAIVQKPDEESPKENIGSDIANKINDKEMNTSNTEKVVKKANELSKGKNSGQIVKKIKKVSNTASVTQNVAIKVKSSTNHNNVASEKTEQVAVKNTASVATVKTNDRCNNEERTGKFISSAIPENSKKQPSNNLKSVSKTKSQNINKNVPLKSLNKPNSGSNVKLFAGNTKASVTNFEKENDNQNKLKVSKIPQKKPISDAKKKIPSRISPRNLILNTKSSPRPAVVVKQKMIKKPTTIIPRLLTKYKPNTTP